MDKELCINRVTIQPSVDVGILLDLADVHTAQIAELNDKVAALEAQVRELVTQVNGGTD